MPASVADQSSHSCPENEPSGTVHKGQNCACLATSSKASRSPVLSPLPSLLWEKRHFLWIAQGLALKATRALMCCLTHSTGLGFPRGLSAVGDAGRAAAGDSLLESPDVWLSTEAASSLAPAWVHTLVERILLVEVEVGVDVRMLVMVWSNVKHLQPCQGVAGE